MIEVGTIILAAIIAVLSYIICFKLLERWWFLQKLKGFVGPPALPIFGNALDLNVPGRDVLPVFGKWFEEFGPRVKVFLGLRPVLFLSNAADVEKILSSATQINKSEDYDLIKPWLGLGLLTSGDKKWAHRRKQLTPAFHFNILEDFLKVFNEQCSTFKNVLEKKGKDKFDIFPAITHCALDIICEAAMGCKINAQKSSDSQYVKAVYRMTELFQYRQLRPWLVPDITWNLSSAGREQRKCLEILHGFTESVINARKKERAEMKKSNKKNRESENDGLYSRKKLAFLDLLLETQEKDPSLTDQNLREETDTFMFEGHDTTSAGASWTTFLLACNPDIQAKVHAEMDRIFGDDRERDVTMADLAEMKYLECCIKEGLRIYPSVPIIGRKLTKDLELANGSVVPVGGIVWVMLYFLHRDPKYFPDPEKFDPTRFFPENATGRHPYAFAAFSAGPRNCIGQKFALMEEKVMLATIFRNFKVIAQERREDIGVLSDVITRPENGLHVRLERG